jgi:hypothetical protein
METSDKHTVWVLTPGGYINSTTEEQAVQLISETPGITNYIFFYADLAVPAEEEEAV